MNPATFLRIPLSNEKSIILKKQFLYLIASLLVPVILLVSCKKDKNEDNPEVSLFYGNWKASYGDTITFSRSNNKNILNYDVSMNPAFAPRANNEFTYKNEKLGIKDGYEGPGKFHFFPSFKWLQKGSVFEIQGMQWFLFLSSSSTYFTFTKIP